MNSMEVFGMSVSLVGWVCAVLLRTKLGTDFRQWRACPVAMRADETPRSGARN